MEWSFFPKLGVGHGGFVVRKSQLGEPAAAPAFQTKISYSVVGFNWVDFAAAMESKTQK